MAKKKEEEKTHIFSIWLLKENITKEDIFEKCKSSYPEVEQIDIARVENAVAFKWKRKKSDDKAWWQEYWDLSGKRSSVYYNAIIIIPIRGRLFVITHGYTNTIINDDVTDSGFASLVILNSLDPKKLSTMKVFQPDASIKQLTQISSSRGLIYIPQLGLDPTAILNDLSGKVLNEYEELFSSVSGGFGKSLKVKSILPLPKIVPFFETLLDISEKDNYKNNFPNALQLETIRDKDKIKSLNDQLEQLLSDKDLFIQLDIPDVADSFDWYWSFSFDKSEKFQIDKFDYEFVEEQLLLKGKEINIETFKKVKVVIYDSEDSGYSKENYTLYRCLSVQLPDEINDSSYQFHLINSVWYQVERSLIDSIDGELEANLNGKNSLKEFPKKESLKTFNEESYNKLLASTLRGVLLDKTNFAPDNQTAVEPCDVFVNRDSKVWFVHTKVYRGSSSLSHLYFQASNSAKLLLYEKESQEKLNELLKQKSQDTKIAYPEIDYDPANLNIVLCVITLPSRKRELNIRNLPLFSKIGLRDTLMTINSLRLDVELKFVNK